MKDGYKIFLLLSLFVLLGTFLRFHHIGLRTFWLDEAASTNLVKYSFSDLWKETAIQDSSPAYIYLVKIWTSWFGSLEISVRSISSIFGLLSIAAIYRLGAYLFNRRAGLWAAFLLAINYFNLFYSIQARPYSMVIFFSILSYYWFVKLLKNPRSISVSILYIIATTIGIYTHIWFFLVLGSQILCWLANYFGKKTSAIFVLHFVPIIIFSLPWASALLRFGNNRGIESYGHPGFGAFGETFHYFMFGSVFTFLVISIVALLFRFIELKKEEKNGESHFRLIEKKSFFEWNPNYFYVAVFLLAPLMAAWIVSQFAPIYVTGRHEAVVLPAFLLLVAAFWANIENKKIIVAAGIVLVALAVQFVEAEEQTIKNYTADDRTIARDLLDKLHSGDFVVYTDLSRPTFEYYLPKMNAGGKKYREISFPEELAKHPGYQIVSAMRKDERGLIRQTDDIISQAKEARPEKIWVIYSSGNPVNKILYNEFNLRLELVSADPMDAGSSPLHYDEILEYRLKGN